MTELGGAAAIVEDSCNKITGVVFLLFQLVSPVLWRVLSSCPVPVQSTFDASSTPSRMKRVPIVDGSCNHNHRKDLSPLRAKSGEPIKVMDALAARLGITRGSRMLCLSARKKIFLFYSSTVLLFFQLRFFLFLDFLCLNVHVGNPRGGSREKTESSVQI